MSVLADAARGGGRASTVTGAGVAAALEARGFADAFLS